MTTSAVTGKLDIIVRMIFGSHLYGTNNNGSDTDYKGVFLPSIRQIYLGDIPAVLNFNTKTTNSKNTPQDIDVEFYSLHRFVKLASQGETVALDMLHAPEDLITQKTPLWDAIVKERQRFYTRNLKAFVGYARRLAAKYGIKGSRLNDAANVLAFCKAMPETTRLAEVWHELPSGEHIFKLDPDTRGVRFYEVCGRKTGETATIAYLQNTVSQFHQKYGARATQAAANEGIDWKALSHAIRAAYQVKQILTESTITFPLREAAYIKQVKEARLDYQSEVAPALELLMDEVETLSLSSNLPDKVDAEFWQNFIVEAVKEHAKP